MMLQTWSLFITLLVGSIVTALPLNEEPDTSRFFDRTDSFPRIIGGTVAGPVPHMVALTTGILTRSFFCGGSLVTDHHVLTAAHCILAVYRGGHLISSLRGNVGTNLWNIGGDSYIFSHNISHPDWNIRIVKNDIAFLVTSLPVSLNAAVQTVALNFNFIGVNAAIVNGWGRFNVTTDESSPRLMELRPFIIDVDQCVEEVARKSAELGYTTAVIPELEICAFLSENTGVCHGDSGSALLLEENKQQIGIVSWGLPCALGAPDVYVRISAYQSWIQQILR